MKLSGIVIGTLICFTTWSQEPPKQNVDPSVLADELFGIQDQDVSYEDLYENMLQLLSSPINVNKATAEDMRFLNVLSETQVQNLITHRENYGPLMSIYELQAVEGIDSVTIERLLPFVEVPDPSVVINHSILRRALDNNNFVIVRYERTLETKRGSTEGAAPASRFKGSADKYYLRFRSSRPGDFSFGLTAEKDVGEQLRWRPASHQYLFDFISYHAQIQNKGKVKNLIVGDFQTQFGQGLMFGGAFGMGKGSEPITTTRRCNVGFTPYTSANEFGLLRGVAATYAITRSISMSAFGSRIRRDANIDDGENESINSLQTTGLHRNASELAVRKNILENNAGIVLHYNSRRLDLGIMYHHVHFEKPVNSSNAVYREFSFAGNDHRNAGIYVNYNYRNFIFFSEIAKRYHGGFGSVGGVIGSVSPKFDLSILYRRYEKDFYSPASNAFAESTLPQNESGIYWGWRYQFTRRVALCGYVDLFRFPWLRFRSYKPASGSEWLTKLSYQPSRRIILFVQAREERKLRNTDESSTTYTTAEGIKSNYWIAANYEITHRLKMKTRAQMSRFQINGQTSKGFALAHDVSCKIGKFEVTARYALFDTDDFDNRQYMYEQDVWLAYSLPAYSGRGVRNFILLEYKPSRSISIWLRYARTRYANVETIGSGLDQIEGNSKNDIKIQLRISL